MLHNNIPKKETEKPYEKPMLTFLMFESKDDITLSNVDQDDNTGDWDHLSVWGKF